VAACLEAEEENLRAAMRWAICRRELAWALCFGWELWRYWLARGAYTEGRAWLAAILALDGAIDSPQYGHVSLAAGALAIDQRDQGAARIHLERGLALGHASGDRALVASILAQLGRLARQEGDLAAARAHCTESLTIRRALGAPWPVAVAQQLIGRVALEQGDTVAARAHLEEGLRLAREIGDGSLLANVLRDLGELALLERDDTRAEHLFDASLARYRGVGHPWSMARCLDALAEVALRQHHPDRAAQLLGEASALRETIAAPLTPADRPRGTRLIACTRAALGDVAFAAAWQSGASLAAEVIPSAR
jgi:tetratricopeptide (TPR) repeat protein